MSFISGGYSFLIVFRVTEDGDPYVRADDENYENDSVRQLENELKMEEYLKQKLQDEAYQVGEGHQLPMFLHKWERMVPLKCPVPGLLGVISSGLPDQLHSKNCCHPPTDTPASSLSA